LGASTSEIHVLGSTNTSGTINITIENTALSVVEPNKPHFSSFSMSYSQLSSGCRNSFLLRTTDAELTDLDYEHFRLEGNARAVANMSIGTLTLDPIKFNVSSGLWGLKGLKGLASIDGVDVLGGTQDALSLGINVTIDNPSNLNLATGDLGMPIPTLLKSPLKMIYSIKYSNCSRTARW
jgi:hypothetical protein